METMVTALDPTIRRHRFSVGDVTRMVDTGILDEDAPVELLAGELVAVSPQGPEHASASDVLADRLRRTLAGGVYVRDEKPLVCGDYSQPEPDLAVVRGGATDFRTRHPRGDEAVLVVEIVRTTQKVARSKAAIYAGAGVPEYWLVELVERTATIHRAASDDGYAEIDVLDETRALVLPGGSTCPLRELLP
jgi:Uma2 family endonuclease